MRDSVQFGPPPGSRRSGPRPDRTRAEEYQKQFARAPLDSGAGSRLRHGTHTVQGVEVYQGKPILYAVGHSAFDQPGYEKSTEGLVIRSVVKDKRLVRVAFVPVGRDDHNNVKMLDPATGEGARLLAIVQGVSDGVPLTIEGTEVVLLDRRAPPTDHREAAN